MPGGGVALAGVAEPDDQDPVARIAFPAIRAAAEDRQR
jgi:hypothetical protein